MWPGTGLLVMVSLRTMDNLRQHLSSSSAAASCGPAAGGGAEPGSQAAGDPGLPASEETREQASLPRTYGFEILECLHCTSEASSLPTFYIYTLRRLEVP